jgi:hypothetical protein
VLAYVAVTTPRLHLLDPTRESLGDPSKTKIDRATSTIHAPKLLEYPLHRIGARWAISSIPVLSAFIQVLHRFEPGSFTFWPQTGFLVGQFFPSPPRCVRDIDRSPPWYPLTLFPQSIKQGTTNCETKPLLYLRNSMR